MPKTAYFLCILFFGNFILSGQSAEVCPKNPLSPTNSISGMVVGTIVGTEKLIDGIFSFFYYLGENSANQVIGATSNLGDFISKSTLKLQDFGAGLLGSIGGQIKTIYDGSTGSIRILFDHIIKTENSAQSFAYKQVQKLSDKVVSGNLTGELSEVVKNPVRTIAKGLKKGKDVTTKLTNNIKNDVKKLVYSVRTTGVPEDVKGIIGAPIRGVKEFVKETGSVIQTVRNETSDRFAGYISEIKHGDIIEKLLAASSFPVGLTLETWSFTLKISEALKNSVAVAVKDVVQPFIGEVLTERLGKIVNLPLDAVEGFYNSIVNTANNLGGFVARITGGGSVGTQLSAVIKHPIVTIGNAWDTTKQETKDFSKALIGEDLTEKLASVFSSPGILLYGTFSTLSDGNVGGGLKSLIQTPVNLVKNIWSQIKLTIGGLTKGIIGEKWTTKLSNIFNSPGKFLSDSISSITGGGSITGQIKEILFHPYETVQNIISLAKSSIEALIHSITGGGSLTSQLTTVLTEPFTLVKHIGNSTKNALKSVTTSITGGGSLTTQLKTLLTSPFDILKSIWSKTKSITDSVTKTLLGDNITSTISQIFTSPFKTISNLYHSLVSLVGGSSASIRISGGAEGDGEAGGGIFGALRLLIEAPFDVVKGTFTGLQSAGKSVANGIKGIFHSIPIIGGGSFNIKVKSGNQESSFRFGGGVKAKGSGSASAGGSSETKEK